MNAPDKIYVHEASAPELAEPVLKEYHIEYIRKDALLEWAKELKEIMSLGGHVSIDDIISKIELL